MHVQGRWDDAVKVLQEMRDEPEEKGPILFNYNHIFGILARARCGYTFTVLSSRSIITHKVVGSNNRHHL